MSAMLWRAGRSTALVALTVLASTGAWYHFHPGALRPVAIEAILVSTQLEHLASLPATDVLILGDSSALTGIDPIDLGARLDRRVESLAMLAWVGPAGYGHVLERAVEHTSPELVLLLLNAACLEQDERLYQQAGFEQMVLEDLPAPHYGLLQQLVSDARGGIFHHVIRQLVGFPLPGTFGRMYGGPDDLASAILRGHGGMVDPNHFKADTRKYVYRVSEATARRLPALRDDIARAAPGKVRLGITPLPQSWVGPRTEATRNAALDQLRQALGLPAGSVIDLPLAYPTEEFATSTHLAATGRAELTKVVAQILEAGGGLAPPAAKP